MTISQALSNANSGLAAVGQRVNVASNNIANALTEGYSRRDVVVNERSVAGVGGGVSVIGVNRATNPALTLERRNADAELAQNEAQSNALTRISNMLGGPDDPNSLFQKYQNFEASLRALADAPDSTALQQAGVTAAKDLTAAFNKLSNNYQQIRLEADAEIYRRVQDVNTAVQQIDDLNDAILRAVATGGDANALLDQRQRLVDAVNEDIPVREIQRENGVIDLMTHEGVFLLSGEPRLVSFTPSPVMTAQTEYNDGAGALSGLSVEGVDITPSGSSTSALSNGGLKGLFAVRDEVVPELSLGLDALALDVAERFSDASIDTTLTAGDPGLFTDAGALAESANLVGLAGRLNINAAVDPAMGGDPQRLRDRHRRNRARPRRLGRFIARAYRFNDQRENTRSRPSNRPSANRF